MPAAYMDEIKNMAAHTTYVYTDERIVNRRPCLHMESTCTVMKPQLHPSSTTSGPQMRCSESPGKTSGVSGKAKCTQCHLAVRESKGTCVGELKEGETPVQANMTTV